MSGIPDWNIGVDWPLEATQEFIDCWKAQPKNNDWDDWDLALYFWNAAKESK